MHPSKGIELSARYIYIPEKSNTKERKKEGRVDNTSNTPVKGSIPSTLILSPMEHSMIVAVQHLKNSLSENYMSKYISQNFMIFLNFFITTDAQVNFTNLYFFINLYSQLDLLS